MNPAGVLSLPCVSSGNAASSGTIAMSWNSRMAKARWP